MSQTRVLAHYHTMEFPFQEFWQGIRTLEWHESEVISIFRIFVGV
jgi:hypothetical protein